MDPWEELVENYSRVADLCTLGKVIRTAEAALLLNLTKFEAEKIAATFLFEPISALDLVRLLQEDSVWTKPLCNIFNVITTLIDKYPQSVLNYLDEIVVACDVSASGRAVGAALRCLRALSTHTARAAAPSQIVSALRTENNARAERALLLGTLCELYPETVTDIEDVCAALLDLLASTDNSESVSEAALRSIAQVLRHFSRDLPSTQLAQIHRHLARHVYCRRCREVVWRTVERHAAALGAAGARAAALRARAWAGPPAAAALYRAVLPHLTATDKQKILTDEVIPRLNSPRAGVRGAARRVLAAAGPPVPGHMVPGPRTSEDVYGLRLRLLVDRDVDYEVADAIWWCIENESDGSVRLLDACVRAHTRLPVCARRRILTRAFYTASTEHVQRRVHMMVREANNDPTALQRFPSLCNEVFAADDQLNKEKLLHLILSTLLEELQPYADYLLDNYTSCELPPTKSRLLSQMATVLSAAKGARLSINNRIISRLKTSLRTVGLRCRPAGDTVEQMEHFLEERGGDVESAGDGAGGGGSDVRERLTAPGGYQHCVDYIDVYAEHLLTEPFILSREDMSRNVSLLRHVTWWCVARRYEGVAAALPTLLDAVWHKYVLSEGFSAGVYLLSIAGEAVKGGGEVARWAGGVLGDPRGDLEDKADVLAVLSDDVLGEEVVGSAVSELRACLPARLEECQSGAACRALLSLLRACSGAVRPALLRPLVAVAAGSSEAGWWKGVLSVALRVPADNTRGVELIQGVFDNVMSVADPIAALDRLLEPLIRRSPEAVRSQWFSDALPSTVAALRGGSGAPRGAAGAPRGAAGAPRGAAGAPRRRPGGLLALRLLLIMMDTVPAALISEQSWRELREACALCVALRRRRSSTDSRLSLVFQQTSYAALCACVCVRRAGVRACACAHGAVWDAVVGELLPELPLVDVPDQVEARGGAFLDELTEDSHQYDLFGDGPFPTQKLQSEKSTAPTPWHPCIEAIASLIRHLVTLTNVEDSPAWSSDLREWLAGAREPVRWLLAQVVCQVRAELLPYARYLSLPLVTIVTEAQELNRLHLDIMDTVISWGVPVEWSSTLVERLARASIQYRVVLPRLASVLSVSPELATEELLGTLFDESRTAGATWRALLCARLRAPRLLPALLARLPSRPGHRDTIVELLASSLDAVVVNTEIQTAIYATLRRVRRDSVRDCLYIISRLPLAHVGDEFYRWSCTVHERLDAAGRRSVTSNVHTSR